MIPELDAQARRAASVVHLSAEGVDPIARLSDLRRTARRRSRLQVAAAFALLVALVAAGVLVGRDDPPVIGPLPSRATIKTGGRPVEVAADDHAVWVTYPLDTLVKRIDPRTGKVVAILRVAQPQDVAIGFGSVWVASQRSGRLLRIDQRTSTLSGSISVTGEPTFVAVGAGAVWVGNADRTVQRDRSGDRRRDGHPPGRRGLHGMTVDEESLWTVGSVGDTVSRYRLPE